MSVINGKLWVVMSDTSVIGATTDATLEITQDTEEVHNKSTADNWKRRISTTKDWKIDFSGMHDPSMTFGAEELIDAIIGANDGTVSYKFQPETPGTGDVLLAGPGILENFSIQSPNQAPQTISGSIVANGPLAKTVEP